MNEEKKETTQETQKPEETKVEETPERADQIAQIADLLSDKPAETEETKTVVEEEKKEPVVEETKTEKVETKEPEKTKEVEPEKKPEEIKAEETKTETKPEEKKPAEKPEEEVEDADHWRTQMNEMAKKIQGGAPAEEKKPAEETKTEKPAEKVETKPAETVKAPPTEFTISKEEFDKAMESEAGFQDVLQSKVSQVASTVVEGRLTEILRSIPKVINDAVDERVTIQLAASDFYRDNPDLTPFKSVVSLVATEVFGENPGIEYDKGFEKVGEEVRKKLKLAKGAVKTVTEKEELKPAFVKGKKARGIQTPDLTGLKSEIADTLEINN